MIGRMWATLSDRSKKYEPPHSRQRLFFDEGPDVIYAVGDVHGCHGLWKSLEAQIKADAEKHDGSKWVIMLGDYVDRGPHSAAVLTDLMSDGATGITRYCLAGNHEDVMLDFLTNPDPNHRWLGLGGVETLKSYGLFNIPADRDKLTAIIADCIPAEHIEFLKSLPALISIPGFCFVHAGVENGVPLAQQEDRHLLWLRPHEQKLSATVNSFLTVHGHTPIKHVALVENRLNVDTGAFMSGCLSAVRISRGDNIRVLRAV